MSISKKIQVKR